MTNNDELALNGYEISNQLRHLADNEIDSYSFAVVTENYNGSEVEFERPITDLALDAVGLIDALLAERDADKKRIAELEESHKKLRETMAAIHNTIRADGAYTPLAAIMSGVKRAYEDSAAVAGIKLEVGE